MKSLETFDALVEAYWDNDLTERERQRLLAIVQADPERRSEFFDSMDFSLRLSAALAEPDAMLPLKIRNILSEATPNNRLVEAVRKSVLSRKARRLPPTRPRARFRFQAMVPLAAAALALIGWGLFLFVSKPPTAWPIGAVVARVEQVQGSAFGFANATPAAETWPLRAGDEIREGMRIETGEDGAVTLAWTTEATAMELAKNSKLETRNSKLAVLQQGRLAAVVAPQPADRPFVVETPHAQATVLGTRFRLEVRGGAGRPTSDARLPAVGSAKAGHPAIPFTRLDVDGGQVRFTRLADQESVNVAAGEFAVAGDDVALKAYPADTEWIEGPILFQDDFQDGFKHWEIGQSRIADAVDEAYVAEQDRLIQPATAMHDGREINGLLMRRGSDESVVPFIRLNRRMSVSAYSVEWNMRIMARGGSKGGSFFWGVQNMENVFLIKGGTMKTSRAPFQWRRNKMAVVPLRITDSQPYPWEVTTWHEDTLASVNRVVFDAGTIGFYAHQGEVMVYRCTIRELIPTDRIGTISD